VPFYALMLSLPPPLEASPGTHSASSLRPHGNRHGFHDAHRQRTFLADSLLRQASVAEIVLAGLATDFCVLNTALDARRLGSDVTVIETGCPGINTQGSLDRAWAQMTQAGVRRG
jgi:nicotinamidase/pyrazinamidase